MFGSTTSPQSSLYFIVHWGLKSLKSIELFPNGMQKTLWMFDVVQEIWIVNRRHLVPSIYFNNVQISRSQVFSLQFTYLNLQKKNIESESESERIKMDNNQILNKYIWCKWSMKTCRCNKMPLFHLWAHLKVAFFSISCVVIIFVLKLNCLPFEKDFIWFLCLFFFRSFRIRKWCNWLRFRGGHLIDRVSKIKKITIYLDLKHKHSHHYFRKWFVQLLDFITSKQKQKQNTDLCDWRRTAIVTITEIVDMDIFPQL